MEKTIKISTAKLIEMNFTGHNEFELYDVFIP